MPIATRVSVLVLALGLEAAFGYPHAIYKRIGHPATWLGALISNLDGALNRAHQSAGLRRAAGVLTLVIIVAIPAVIAWFIERVLVSDWAGNLVLAVLTSTLLASRSLYVHVRDVAGALETGSIIAARSAVSRIVGRDLPGLAAYKAINTADSMIGHRKPRHEAFGWAAARFDDLLNLLPSRLTGLLFAAAALVVPGASTRAAIQAMASDASRHRSPNAGWPESAMAGALGLKLNGPKNYAGVLVNDAYMGNGRREATGQDIRDALRLASMAWAIMVAALLITAVILRT